ncbi:MAG: hypothetical protein ACREF4_08215, partial [Gammaproteobacteria bacterium]
MNGEPQTLASIWRVLQPLLLPVYLAGVAVGLLFTDARGPARLALALLWPVGFLAFAITVSILFVAALVAFPVFGAIVIAGALAAAAFAQPLGGGPVLEARFIGNMAYA